MLCYIKQREAKRLIPERARKMTHSLLTGEFEADSMSESTSMTNRPNCRLVEEKANPYNWKNSYKWLFTLVAAIVTLCVAFASSCYTGAAAFLIAEFHVSREIIVLGVTLFVLGVSG